MNWRGASRDSNGRDSRSGVTEPLSDHQSGLDDRTSGWFRRGMAGIASVPAVILMVSFIGFGVLCRESGLSLGQSVFMTAMVWALPSQVVLVGAVSAGTPLVLTAIAVALSAVRLTPMVAAWVPLVRSQHTRRYQLLLLSHFVAITAWIFAMMRLPDVPRRHRVRYFAGFAVTLFACNIAITAASFSLASEMPVVLVAALFFLTPIYFLTAMSAAARLPAEVYALVIGLVADPVLFAYAIPLDIVWAGLVGGSLAYLFGRLRRRGARS